MKRFTGFLISVALLAALFTVPASAASSAVYTSAELFTDRDLRQTADLAGAVKYTVSDGQDIRITTAGVYVITGAAGDATVIVEAGKDDKVQLVCVNDVQLIRIVFVKYSIACGMECCNWAFNVEFTDNTLFQFINCLVGKGDY